MTVRLLRKPPVGAAKSDRLKITLAGNHTLKQKTCMLMQVKFWLHQEHGIDYAGPTDAYLALLDPNGFGAFEFVCFAKDAPTDGLRMFGARATSEVRYP